MPLREQWAHCYIKRYRNFGVRVTSPAESLNLNVKSYLLNGKSDVLRLIDSLIEMCQEQYRTFEEAMAREGTRMRQTYLNRIYLGSLPLKVSYKGLDLINREYRYAKAAIPNSKRDPMLLSACDSDCTVSL